MIHEVKFEIAEEINLRHSTGPIVNGGLFVFEIKETQARFPVIIKKADGWLSTPTLMNPPKAFFKKSIRAALMGEWRDYDRKTCRDGSIQWHLFPLVEGGTSERDKKLNVFITTCRVFRCEPRIYYAKPKKLRGCDPSSPPVRKIRQR